MLSVSLNIRYANIRCCAKPGFIVVIVIVVVLVKGLR